MICFLFRLFLNLYCALLIVLIRRCYISNKHVVKRSIDVSFMNNLCIATPIGEGGFGFVYKGYEKETGAVRAIKKIPLEKIINYQSIINEVTALKNLDHPNIIKLYEVYEAEGCIFLVQEY